MLWLDVELPVIRSELLEVGHQDLGPVDVLGDREQRTDETVTLGVHREREHSAEFGILDKEHRIEVRGKPIAVGGYGVEALSDKTSVQEESPPRTRVTMSATFGHYPLPVTSAAESPDSPHPAHIPHPGHHPAKRLNRAGDRRSSDRG